MFSRTHDGQPLRMLAIIDEYTRECLAIGVARRLNSEDVLDRLSDLFVRRGTPNYIHSDNGPEFTADRVRDWLERVDVKTLYLEPGSPWENGYTNPSMENFAMIAQRGAIRHSVGSRGPDRTRANLLQHDQTSQLAGLPASSTGSYFARRSKQSIHHLILVSLPGAGQLFTQPGPSSVNFVNVEVLDLCHRKWLADRSHPLFPFLLTN